MLDQSMVSQVQQPVPAPLLALMKKHVTTVAARGDPLKLKEQEEAVQELTLAQMMDTRIEGVYAEAEQECTYFDYLKALFQQVEQKIEKASKSKKLTV